MYGKNEILELYLNKVYFGGGLYGVEAASRGYFAKACHDLTIDEAALLAGLIQSPSSYAPSVNLDRAVARRNVVLQAMVSTGAIDQATADRARVAPVKIVNGLEIEESSGLYFKEQVRRSSSSGLAGSASIRAAFASTRRSIPPSSAPPRRSSKKGCRTSSIVPGYKHPRRGVGRSRSRRASLPQYLQGALVAMDPTTGYVRAMVGGRDFDESRFNRAIQAKRQSGSAFKPFVYATALEAGYSPATGHRKPERSDPDTAGRLGSGG